MRPTSAELLTSIAQELEDRVLPVVQDKWGASTVRSAMQLLRHLSLRVPLEPRILAEDNKDARATLELAHERLSRLGASDLASVAADALGSAAEDALDIEAVDALNEKYLRAIEMIVAARDRLRLIDDPPTIHASLIDYLKRRLEREHGLFLPVFLSAPF